MCICIHWMVQPEHKTTSFLILAGCVYTGICALSFREGFLIIHAATGSCKSVCASSFRDLGLVMVTIGGDLQLVCLVN